VSNQEFNGPLMLAATKVLRTKVTDARIGKIGNNITLPRSVTVGSLFGVGAGAFIGLFVGLVVGGVQPVLYAMMGGATLGYLAVTYTPSKGESLWRWIGLSAQGALRRQMTYRGKPVRLAVGIALVATPPRGWVRIFPGAVDVPAGSRDERGVPIDNKERLAGLARPAGTIDPLFGPGKRLPDDPARNGSKRSLAIPSLTNHDSAPVMPADAGTTPDIAAPASDVTVTPTAEPADVPVTAVLGPAKRLPKNKPAKRLR
jgi:hypothetical protein